MESLFIDCCYPRLTEGHGRHLENLREFVSQEALMDMDEPMSPRVLDSLENSWLESPQPSHRTLPRCPNAPRKVSRDMDVDDEDDQMFASASDTSVPLFPFDTFHRVDSQESTFLVPKRLFVLSNLSEPTLMEETFASSTVHIIKPDEEREPMDEENEQEDARQKPYDSDDSYTA